MSTITFSPITSILENKSAGTIVTGSPGSGKTYFLLNVASNCLLTGCKVIYLDPKNDAFVLKNIDPDISVIDINNIKPGSLNPFTMFNNLDTNSILSIINCICGNIDDNKMVAISPIVKDFVNLHKRNMTNISFSSLADYLYASENEFAQAVGNTLKVNEDSEYGPLIFGETKENFFLGNNSIVISFLGLQLPNANKNKGELNQEEKFASTIVYLICKFLSETLRKDSRIPTVLFIDEAHVVYINEDISGVIDNFLVLGRSLNVATVLASQNVTHFPTGIAQLIANKFMFRMSNQEAEEFLRIFDSSNASIGLDRQSIIERITNAEKGECFMIDNKNRGGFLKVKSNLGVTSNPLLKKRK